MKKIILLAAALVLAAATVSAQPRAIGLRLGAGDGVSYQHTLGNNMLSIDADIPGLGFGFFGVGATATYDWLNPFGTSINWTPRGEWNWYLGVGAEAGMNWIPNGYTDHIFDTQIHVGVAGRAGLEYTFWFPLQLAVEWRPAFGPSFNNTRVNAEEAGKYKTDVKVGYYDRGLWAGAIALCVRYRFGM